MKLNRLRLENVFCYREADIDFLPGVCVFAGPNGAGKSSLLEAVFFALFGSQIKPISGREMADVLRKGSNKGSVALDFELDHPYSVHMALKRSGKRVAADGAHCVLHRQDGDESWQGVTAVTDKIRALLHMNADDFANCLYVRQGEVDRLLKASAAQRQSDMDRLLRLDALDRYERRLKDGGLRAFNRRQDRLMFQQERIQQSLGELQTKDLAASKFKLETQLAELDGQQKSLERETSALSESLQNVQQQLSQFEETQQSLVEINKKIKASQQALNQSTPHADALRNSLQQTEQAVQAITLQLEQCQQNPLWQECALSENESVDDLLSQIEQQHQVVEDQLQRKRDALTEARTERRNAETQAQQQAQALQAIGLQIETAQQTLKLAEHPIQDALGQLDVTWSGQLGDWSIKATRNEQQILVDQLRDCLNTTKNDRTKSQTELDGLLMQSREIDALVDAAQCPTCRQPITQATLGDHTQHLTERIHEHEKRLADLKLQQEAEAAQLSQAQHKLQALSEVGAQLRDLKTHVQALARLNDERQKGQDQQQWSDANLEKWAQQEKTILSEGDALKQTHETLTQRLTFVKAVDEKRDTISALKDKAGTERQALGEMRKNLDTLKKDLQAYHDYKDVLKATLGGDDTDALNEKKQALAQQLNSLNANSIKLEQARDAHKLSLGQLLKELETQAQLQQEAKEVAGQLKQLEQALAETEALRALYHDIKYLQRQKNLNALNAVFNHFFKLMDASASYDGVLLDEQFDISVQLNNGDTLSPSLLSGGERALVNLALRAAMHRVICEAGGTRLPLFFDEPTVFLDDARVHRLEQLFEELGREVGQVVIVSHESALVESADHEFSVLKTADNLGRVEKVR